MTATCHRRPPSRYPSLLRDEAERFVDVVYGAPADLEVPACPGWSVRQVGEHIGGLFRWAEAHVRTGSRTRIRGRDLDLQIPESFESQPEWIYSGLKMLTSSLESNDPDKELWTWGSDKRARFWGRRMLFETTIHRADVELAVGRDPQIDHDTAADGIDEFLDNLPLASYFASDVDKLRGDNKTLKLRTADTGIDWSIRLYPERFEWDHDLTTSADASIAATSSDLLLFVYGRRGADEADRAGDPALVDLWVVNSRI